MTNGDVRSLLSNQESPPLQGGEDVNGDSGGNQAAQKQVAEQLTRLWQGEGVRVIHVNDYYEHNLQSA
ncbi:MAG: hypothetical protein PHG00_03860, partial [Methylococcales bacterium]|nr:hypothetical protein [Methylococcales bacterium]